MLKKTISITILFAILSLFLISLISADYNDDYIYAGNGIIVYPNYIIKQVCKPFMPCGVERIDIPSQKNYRYNDYYNNPETTGQALYKELSSPGFSRVIADQRSPTYDPLYNEYDYSYDYRYSDNYYRNYYDNDYSYGSYSQNYRNRDYQEKAPIVYVDDKNSKKHFANTYNTRNNYDSNSNWIGDSNNNNNRNYQQPNSNVVVVYMN